jgi:hypothetical protein
MYPNQFNVIDNQVVEVKTIVVHRFKMGDVEDPDLYAAEPIWKWQESEMGKWVMDHAVDQPEWHKVHEVMTYGYQYAIVAKLTAKDYTYWALKWGNNP